MKRTDIRVLKRRLAGGEVADAALLLLRRSVQFRHGRLAAKRLDSAVAAGAQLPADVVSYFASLPADQRQAMLCIANHPVARKLLGGGDPAI